MEYILRLLFWSSVACGYKVQCGSGSLYRKGHICAWSLVYLRCCIPFGVPACQPLHLSASCKPMISCDGRQLSADPSVWSLWYNRCGWLGVKNQIILSVMALHKQELGTKSCILTSASMFVVVSHTSCRFSTKCNTQKESPREWCFFPMCDMSMFEDR